MRTNVHGAGWNGQHVFRSFSRGSYDSPSSESPAASLWIRELCDKKAAKYIFETVRQIRNILTANLQLYLGPEDGYFTDVRFIKVGLLQTTGIPELEAAMLVRKEGRPPK